MRQAVVLIHGIGEQEPMANLRDFVETVLPSAGNGEEKFWRGPDVVVDHSEFRRLKSRGRNPTDFYELYWAHQVRDTRWTHVMRWLLKLLFRSPKSVPRSIFALWSFAWVMVATTLVFLITDRFTPLAHWISLQSPVGISWVVLYVLVLALQWLFLYYLGDAARYLDRKPDNITLRQNILEEGMKLLRHLHESNQYDRIIIVGHSLGSVIGYDLIARLWAEQHNKSDFISRRDNLEQILLRGEPPQPFIRHQIYEKGRLLTPDNSGVALQAFRAAQVGGWKEQRRWGHPWRITDFITLGSPLAHARLLLAKSGSDFLTLQRQREFLTCPPSGDAKGYAYVDANRLTLPSGRIFTPLQLHYAAAFAVTRWTNLYVPAIGGIFGDVIGGPLTKEFGPGVKDVQVTIRGLKRFTFLAHNAYWTKDLPIRGSFAESTSMPHASGALLDSLQLDQLGSFKEAFL